MTQPEFDRINIEEDFREQNFMKRKIDCLREEDENDLAERKKICTQFNTNTISRDLKNMEVHKQNPDFSNLVVKSEPCINSVQDVNKTKSTKQAEKRTPGEEVDALVQKLGWTGDVKHVCIGKKANQNFAVCHNCQTLVIGGSDKIKRHIISHYNNEILKMFPSGKDCSICKKTFRYPAELAFHYAITHEMAKEVIPSEYIHVKNVPEFLKFENSPVVDLLVEKLGWYGEVQQFDFGVSAKSKVYFVVCQHCPKLLVGRTWQLRPHMISHHAGEILKNFPNKDQCGICEKKFNASYPSSLVYHYAMKHGLANKFIPEEDLQFVSIFDVLQDKSDLKLLADERRKAKALRCEIKERLNEQEIEIKQEVVDDSDEAPSDDDHDLSESNLDTKLDPL